MAGWSRLISMELTDEQKLDMAMPMPIASEDMPAYPYGLRICLTQDELEKLDLEPDCNIGDVIDLRAFARVTSVSINQMADGRNCSRVELQITDLSIEEESRESGDEE